MPRGDLENAKYEKKNTKQKTYAILGDKIYI